uniref:Uncharacterized protein n=1 Tax=Pseudomonas phage Ulitu01 TaxID=3138550 RepID=A0AAU6W024_9CAUD
MTAQQIKWAAAHDWYLGHGTNADNQLFVKVRHEYLTGESQFFTNYQELREWAGY